MSHVSRTACRPRPARARSARCGRPRASRRGRADRSATRCGGSSSNSMTVLTIEYGMPDLHLHAELRPERKPLPRALGVAHRRRTRRSSRCGSGSDEQFEDLLRRRRDHPFNGDNVGDSSLISGSPGSSRCCAVRHRQQLEQLAVGIADEHGGADVRRARSPRRRLGNARAHRGDVVDRQREVRESGFVHRARPGTAASARRPRSAAARAPGRRGRDTRAVIPSGGVSDSSCAELSSGGLISRSSTKPNSSQ